MLEKYKITRVTGRCIPLTGNNIDTDRIIPARYLKCVTFDELGDKVFFDERFDTTGNPLDHPFNSERFRTGSILLVNRNFGSGSSREHAPQALKRFGIEAIAGESFAEIFRENCVKTGIVTVTLDPDIVSRMMEVASEYPEITAEIDLGRKTFRYGDYTAAAELPESSRYAYINGTWNATAFLIANKNEIIKVAERLDSFQER